MINGCKLITLCLAGAFFINLGAQVPEIRYEEYTLDNGLHIILHRDNSSPVVAVNVMYHVGSKNEKPDRTGFAHFFEHLMFEGSPNIERGEYFKIVQNAGGENNAFTTFDLTAYFETMPSNQLALALWLESERMLQLKIDSMGLETQRKVVKEERRQRYENQPYGSLLQEVFSRAFTDHPYHWIPIGENQYIDQATLDEFMQFYKQYYVPQNAVLVVAGDIAIDSTRGLIAQYFSDIPRGVEEIYRPNPTDAPLTAEIRDTVYDNIQLPALIRAYRMPPSGHPDSYALAMLQKVLSDGQSSRFYKELVDNRQLSVQVGAIPLSLQDAGLFIAYSFANMGINLSEIEQALNAEVEKIKKEGITAEELVKIKNQTESDFVNTNTKMEGIALNLAEYYTMLRNPGLINSEIDRYLAVTPEDIVRVAKQYLIPDNSVVLYYLPHNEAL